MATVLASYGFNVTPPMLQDFMREKNLFPDECNVYFTAVDSYTGNTGSNAKVRYDGRFLLNGHYEKLINSNGYAIANVSRSGFLCPDSLARFPELGFHA